MYSKNINPETNVLVYGRAEASTWNTPLIRDDAFPVQNINNPETARVEMTFVTPNDHNFLKKPISSREIPTNKDVKAMPHNLIVNQ